MYKSIISAFFMYNILSHSLTTLLAWSWDHRMETLEDVRDVFGFRPSCRLRRGWHWSSRRCRAICLVQTLIVPKNFWTKSAQRLKPFRESCLTSLQLFFVVFQNFLFLSFLLLIATCFEASKPLKQPWNILSPRSEDRNEESNEQLWLAMSHEQYVFSNSSATFHKLQIYLVDRTMFQQVFQCVFVGGTLCKRLSNGSSS